MAIGWLRKGAGVEPLRVVMRTRVEALTQATTSREASELRGGYRAGNREGLAALIAVNKIHDPAAEQGSVASSALLINARPRPKGSS